MSDLRIVEDPSGQLWVKNKADRWWQAAGKYGGYTYEDLERDQGPLKPWACIERESKRIERRVWPWEAETNCPTCGVNAGERCKTIRPLHARYATERDWARVGQPTNPHAARIDAYQKQFHASEGEHT